MDYFEVRTVTLMIPLRRDQKSFKTTSAATAVLLSNLLTRSLLIV